MEGLLNNKCLTPEKDVPDMERRREERLREEAWALNSARREGYIEGYIGGFCEGYCEVMQKLQLEGRHEGVIEDWKKGQNYALKHLLDEGIIDEATYEKLTQQ